MEPEQARIAQLEQLLRQERLDRILDFDRLLGSFYGMQLVLRLLRDRLGDVPWWLEDRIVNLPLSKRMELGLSQFDFAARKDLENWLDCHAPKADQTPPARAARTKTSKQASQKKSPKQATK